MRIRQIRACIGFLILCLAAQQPVNAAEVPAQSAPLPAAVAAGVVVHVVDVGNGDAAWIRLADGSTALIDCGPVDPNRRLLLALQEAGVSQIDLLAPSRSRADALGGCADVARYLTVTNVLWSGPASDVASRTFQAALDAQAAQNGQPVNQLPATAGWSQDYGNSRLSLFNPAPTSAGDAEDDSQVLLLEYGRAHALFTGAIHAAGENQALNAGLSGYQVDMLRVADHGVSGTSSEAFLNAVFSSPGPRLAILSYSPASTAAHPDPDVIRRLRDSGAALESTAQNGSITVLIGSDGTLSSQTER
jgi:competence protein ComEC